LKTFFDSKFRVDDYFLIQKLDLPTVFYSKVKFNKSFQLKFPRDDKFLIQKLNKKFQIQENPPLCGFQPRTALFTRSTRHQAFFSVLQIRML
jgi:hypothetical protein